MPFVRKEKCFYQFHSGLGSHPPEVSFAASTAADALLKKNSVAADKPCLISLKPITNWRAA